MIDNNYIINNGYYSMFLEFKKYLYKNFKLDAITFTDHLKAFSDRSWFWYYKCDTYFPLLFENLEIYDKCRKLYLADKALYQRLRKRITSLITKPCLFLTFDFSDNDFKFTTEAQRRKAISSFCRKQCTSYVANIDFGKKNGREHYHAIVQTDNINFEDFVFKKYKFEGWVKYEKVWTVNDSAERMSKYITKLTRHAVKTTTKRYRIIYSKK